MKDNKQLKWENGINYTPNISNYILYSNVNNILGCHYIYFITARRDGYFVLSTIEFLTESFEKIWQIHPTLEKAKNAAYEHYLEQINNS